MFSSSLTGTHGKKEDDQKVEEIVDIAMFTSCSLHHSRSPSLTVTQQQTDKLLHDECEWYVPVASGGATATLSSTEAHSPSLGDVNILV